MKILLVEDEPRSAHYLRKGLVENGFSVDVMGPNAETATPRADYDLMVCNLPLEAVALTQLPNGRRPPVLFLADRAAAAQLTSGPGECLSKPFAFSDFLARVRRLLQSTMDGRPMTLRIAGLELDLVRHRASRDARRLDLTPKEFLLLSLLMRRSGEVLSRAFIADQVWEINFDSNTNFVDVHIRRLRAKVDDPSPGKLIHTVRGMGYVLEER
jgi:two-component system copper resistance phosphate regulon response regulator CusR